MSTSLLLNSFPVLSTTCNNSKSNDAVGNKAEERRKKALEEKKKNYLENKSVISAALLSLNSDGPVNRLNKKIKFTDYDTDNTCNDSCEEINLGKEHKQKRKNLFEESDESDSEPEINFDKKKCKKFVQVKSQLVPDDRFVMDEKFCESESDEGVGEGVNSMKISESDNDKKKDFNLLETSQEVPSNVSKEQCHLSSYNIVEDIRYDPLKKNHSKYELQTHTTSSVPEVTSGLPIETDHCHRSRKKKLKIEAEQMTNQMPVETSKYYIVNDQLIKNFQKEKTSSFSLLEMFGDPKKNDENKRSDESTLIPTTKKNTMIQFLKNPFKYDSSDSENEELEKNEEFDDYLENENGTFFFRENDQRIRDGFDLFKNGNSVSSMSFEEMRVLLKEIVKKKVQRNAKKESKKKYGNKKFKFC